jgi:antirestriction protein
MTQLFAQPYDTSAHGFFFETAEEYQEKADKNLNSYGQKVEEYELQFIEGDGIDSALFKALSVGQCNAAKFLEIVDEWDEHDKRKVIIAIGDVGYKFDWENSAPDDFEVDVYECDSMEELAEQFVDEGLFGEIPKHLEYYIDYEKIARDLKSDYSETEIDGTRLIYRAA